MTSISPSSSSYVTILSTDGHEFVVARDAACVSDTIKRMLDSKSAFAEAITGRIQLDLSSVVLEKVCEYFYYNLKHKGSKNVPDMEIPPELCLELLMAADYLNV
ncbi:Transcription elongation factor B (SIII), polypeptide 1 (15kDa, elongin C) [Puttea exsequens]|nr:Transcription elongation factor B (SIII), polypeptide 1 (15kDa, elongin C) [Puttea exsequens]